MKKILIGCIVVLLAAGLIGAVINFYVIWSGGKDIAFAVDSPDLFLEEEGLSELIGMDADCILVLGASVQGNTPSKMLKDRLDAGIALYQAGVAPKLLFSGDNGQVEYNEVAVMQEYALAAGVPAEDIFLDHAGFSTYESMYRARDVFLVERAVVVTQGYHLGRALFVGQSLGLDVMGVASDQEEYSGQLARDIREVAARIKDFFMVLLEPEPTFLGDPIPISGDGQDTL